MPAYFVLCALRSLFNDGSKVPNIASAKSDAYLNTSVTPNIRDLPLQRARDERGADVERTSLEDSDQSRDVSDDDSGNGVEHGAPEYIRDFIDNGAAPSPHPAPAGIAKLNERSWDENEIDSYLQLCGGGQKASPTNGLTHDWDACLCQPMEWRMERKSADDKRGEPWASMDISSP